MAIVTGGSAVAFGLARMFELLAEAVSCETRVLSELPPALEWLGVAGAG